MDLVNLATFDNQLPFLTYKGRLCTPAKAFGAVLGYDKDGNGLVDSISSNWASEFKPGHHFTILKGKTLRDFKSLTGVDGLNPSSAPKLMVLLESGINRVLLLTKKPIGVAVRDFLDTKVMPQLTKTGMYLPERSAKCASLTKPPSRAALNASLHHLMRLPAAMRRLGCYSPEAGECIGQRLWATLLQLPEEPIPGVKLPKPPQQLLLAEAPKARPPPPPPTCPIQRSLFAPSVLEESYTVPQVLHSAHIVYEESDLSPIGLRAANRYRELYKEPLVHSNTPVMFKGVSVYPNTYPNSRTEVVVKSALEYFAEKDNKRS
jgi:hypothetical protein